MLDHNSVGSSVFGETSFAIFCKEGQKKSTKKGRRTRTQGLWLAGAITFKYFEDANVIWVLWLATPHGGGPTGRDDTQSFPDQRKQGLGTYLIVLALHFVVTSCAAKKEKDDTSKDVPATIMLQCNANKQASHSWLLQSKGIQAKFCCCWRKGEQQLLGHASRSPSVLFSEGQQIHVHWRRFIPHGPHDSSSFIRDWNI